MQTEPKPTNILLIFRPGDPEVDAVAVSWSVVGRRGLDVRRRGLDVGRRGERHRLGFRRRILSNGGRHAANKFCFHFARNKRAFLSRRVYFTRRIGANRERSAQ